MAWFTSLKDHLVYSMEKEMVVARIGERERERAKEAISFGIALL